MTTIPEINPTEGFDPENPDLGVLYDNLLKNMVTAQLHTQDQKAHLTHRDSGLPPELEWDMEPFDINLLVPAPTYKATSSVSAPLPEEDLEPEAPVPTAPQMTFEPSKIEAKPEPMVSQVSNDTVTPDTKGSMASDHLESKQARPKASAEPSKAKPSPLTPKQPKATKKRHTGNALFSKKPKPETTNTDKITLESEDLQSKFAERQQSLQSILDKDNKGKLT